MLEAGKMRLLDIDREKEHSTKAEINKITAKMNLKKHRKH